ncbi:hypothetical protein DFH06DRAFT_238678 [Mycena polygramma]|nr:hypothetical protein DFH06DRAFT_238678 [Mycena polygramma]
MQEVSRKHRSLWDTSTVLLLLVSRSGSRELERGSAIDPTRFDRHSAPFRSKAPCRLKSEWPPAREKQHAGPRMGVKRFHPVNVRHRGTCSAEYPAGEDLIRSP